MSRLLKIISQVILLSVIAFAMNRLAAWLNLPISGSILGIILVFTLLKCKIIRLSWIEEGANWLLAEIVLFFIPIAVGIMEYKNMLLHDGFRIAVVIVISTALVMSATGLIAQQIVKMKEQKQS
ncbi:CidA/LrgA family protein [Paenibacillus albiflavus]|uniref:CidA/LrgA family protein n=1 Tax=Paenibacillus albiflavus TaxID=2545760 RepID=A0A4R4EK39_9BACL|nr:CidA/LrgA family protein [Paenibacillus albiflavus]TCZ78751.1 CidA/LrgA family protein [Paenibacillus albiflavus]